MENKMGRLNVLDLGYVGWYVVEVGFGKGGLMVLFYMMREGIDECWVWLYCKSVNF